jgi:hypothetical protein
VKFRVFWDVAPVVNFVLTDVSEVRAAFIIRAVIALMMEVVHTSETSVNTNFTRRYIPEDSKLLKWYVSEY